MATDKELELQAAQEAANLLVQQQAPATVTADPSKITQSYYTSKSAGNNYESNQPVYTQSDAVKQAASELATKEAAKPTEYKSQYGDQIQALLNQALNRPAFNYDFSKDPMYNMYAEKYQQQGKQASKSAIGAASALTGGYANSYAQTAGQQAYQQYMTGLNDVLPELRNAAYQQYSDQGTQMQNNLSMLQGQESLDYNRYRDTVTDYMTELDYFRQKYQDMTEAEYQRYLNDVSLWESDRSYYYQKEQDDYAKAQAAKKSSGSSSKKKTASTANVPTDYSTFVALTKQSGVMTETEYKRRNPSGNYATYLKTMWAKYM